MRCFRSFCFGFSFQLIQNLKTPTSDLVSFLLFHRNIFLSELLPACHEQKCLLQKEMVAIHAFNAYIR